jgi:N-acetylglucosaminyl-diphospho-decaprenol L-rhamnosyltransferase
MTRRQITLALVLLCLLGFALRVGVILHQKAYLHNPGAAEHDTLARTLLEHGRFLFADFGYWGPTSVQSPPFPFLLAGAYKVFGVGTPKAFLAMMIFNAVIGAGTIWLTYLLARTMGAGAGVGLLAAGLLAIWPTQLYAPTHVQAIAFITAAMVGVTILFYRAVRTGAIGPWITFSLVGTLGALTEPVLLPMMAFTGILILFMRELEMRKRIRNAAILLAAAIVVIGPWTIRNRMIHGQWIPIKSTFWVNVWKGNNPYASGTDRLKLTDEQAKVLQEQLFSTTDEQLRSKQIDSLRQYDMLTDEQRARLWNKTEVEREAVFKDFTTTWISENTGRYVELCFIRLGKTLYIDWDNPKSHNFVYIASRWAILLLTAGGLVVAIRRRWSMLYPGLLIGSCLLTYTLTITAARFSFPFEPFQLCVGAAAIGWVLALINGRRAEALPIAWKDGNRASEPAETLRVIIVNFRTPQMTIDCLRSLAGEVGTLPGPLKVTVVENGSGDDSAGRIEQAIRENGWSSWAEILPLDRNWGFAGGNNRGIAHAGPQAKYYLLLNSDTLVNPGVLAYCCNVMDCEPQIGIMSCMLRNRDGTWQNVARRFPTPISQIATTFGLPWSMPRLFRWADVASDRPELENVKHDTDWVGGAFMLIRGEALRQLGGLDESFFFLGEDIEICYRYHKAGWRVHYDPAVRITHFGGQSSGENTLPSRQKMLHNLAARYKVQRRCYGRLASATLRFMDIIAYCLRYAWIGLRGRTHTPHGQYHRQILQLILRPLNAARPA